MTETKTGVILAAGKGERLDRQDTIKPLVRVANRPLIFWAIEFMQEVGIERIYIVLGYNGDLLRKELIETQIIKPKIQFIENDDWENGMLYSILRLKNVGGPFFLSPCDLVFQRNPYSSFMKLDLTSQKIIALIDRTNEKDDISGARSKIIVKKDGTAAFLDSPTEYDGIETGIYHFANGMISELADVAESQEGINSLTSGLACLSGKGFLQVCHLDRQKWFDVNTPSIRIRAEMILRRQPSFQSNRSAVVKQQLVELKRFETFITKKEVETEIYVKRNCIEEIDTFELIPESHAKSPHFIITDERVDRLFGKQVYERLLAMGYNIKKISLSAGESIKTLENFNNLTQRILAEGIDERTILISLGGGTINNITGFLASTLYRGIYLIHIPTTLMAQCDAAIGIKQAVNWDKGKNLVGTYYEPLKIVVDPVALLTSSERWLRDGLVECIKHALAQDPEFYSDLTAYGREINDIDFLEYVVKKTIQLKCRLMSADPKEQGEALALQYGHTIGHAVEYLSGYKLGHGESVAIGMRAAAEVSKILDIADDDLVESHCDILTKFGLSVSIPEDIGHEDIIVALRYNKRFVYGEVQLVLLHKIGSLWSFGGDYSVPCDNSILARALLNSY